ncbi:unnamed protein product [Medioppia subpectinata]|uniref:Uncharacterized protein n=1 Tax=Medioppia subpectinata TaxID=1979941 RepID=A0A7R9KPL0_9ACAR|nr:unnamed protein product [Medioppia subpectinata]CAG2106327.1 unnamed protein product [Medioppia subpectinata]
MISLIKQINNNKIMEITKVYEVLAIVLICVLLYSLIALIIIYGKNWEALRVYCPAVEMDIMNPFPYYYNPKQDYLYLKSRRETKLILMQYINASHLRQTSYQRTVEGRTRRPVSIAAETVLALGITGNTEASQTLRLLAPLTLNWGSTTTSDLSIAPIRQVPVG